ncbi:MAG: hypothetical protein AAF652_07125 [Cyanobacteria bacterium P01_C01_bin.72]
MPETLPFLESICWQTADVYGFSPEQMLSRYERGWRYRHNFPDLSVEELEFIRQLAQQYNSWLQAEL